VVFSGRLAVLALLAVVGCGRWGFGDRATDRGDSEPGDDGVVTISLITTAGPLQGTPIIVHNADGELLGELVTDVNGQAWGWIPPGGMITIPDAGGNNYIDRARRYAARTIMGLEPGMEITIGSSYDPWAYDTIVGVTFSEEFLGADSYSVTAGCAGDTAGSWTGSMELKVGEECRREATDLTLVGRAYDVDGNLLASSVLEGLAMDAETAVMPAWTASAPVAANLAVSGTPAYADDVDGRLYSLYRGLTYDSASDSVSSVGSAGAQFSFDLHDERLDARRVAVSVDFDDPNDPDAPDSVLFYRAKRSTTDTTVTVDFDDMSMPIVRSVAVDTDGPRPSFTIDSEGNTFDGADHRFTVIEWLTADDHEYEWMFMHPPGMDSFPMPEMPKEFENYLLGAEDEVLALETAVFDYDFVVDYQDMLGTFGFELFALEFWLAPVEDWSWKASAGPGGFRRL
jgi:hypothetical protein